MTTRDAKRWARICRIEAMRTSHGPTRDFLLEMAVDFEILAYGKPVELSPDDPDLQEAVGHRLLAAAAKRRSDSKSSGRETD